MPIDNEIFGDLSAPAKKQDDIFRDVPATVNPTIAAQGAKRGFGVNVDIRPENDPTRGGGTLKFGSRFGTLDTGLPMSEGVTNFLTGIGRGLTNAETGARQLLGIGPTRAQVDQQRELDKPLMGNPAAIAGNVTGDLTTVLPAMFVPGVNTMLGGGVVGGLLGAGQPVGESDSRLANAGISAGVGAGVPLASAVASRIVSPQTRQPALDLMREGITPTPGQIMGGFAQRMEDKLTSIPILGDSIKYAQRKGIDELNTAVYKRALNPIGEKPLATIGRDAVDDVYTKLSDSYNKLLPTVSFKADPQFSAEISKISAMAQQLPKQQAAQFERILKTQFVNKITPAGTASGERLKEIESELGRLVRGYSKDPAFDNQQLGAALSEVQSSIRDSLVRANPSKAAELKKINEGYANYVRLRSAAGGVGATDGVFTPSQLSASVRANDKSVAHGDYARGRAFMQDLSDPARSALNSTYPDSGTVGRLLLGGSALGAGAINPLIPGILGAASLPYMAGGRQVSAALLARRPEIAKPIARAIKAIPNINPLLIGASPYAGLLSQSNE